MQNSSIFVMVSGPAASGKSTLVDKMVSALPAYFYKPSKAYFDLAKAKVIPLEKAFQEITTTEAENYFCRVCKSHDITIGDQHLSIQPIKDTAIALGNTDIIFSSEPYVSAINYGLFDMLNENEIRALLIYLKASAEALYARAYQRNLETGMFIRNRTISEVKEEVEAEEYYYNELINRAKIDSYVIDTESLNSEEVLKRAVKRVLKLKG